ncbi:HAD family hydrolase, partial [Burkholderia gladioli]|nr:HAD family hydrolase [Burkholderia gladioli]
MTDRIVAAFDFDGTITTADSFQHFVRRAVGTRRFACAGLRALPWILAMNTGLISRGAAKARFAWFAFGPMPARELDALATASSQPRNRPMFRPASRCLASRCLAAALLAASACFAGPARPAGPWL